MAARAPRDFDRDVASTRRKAPASVQHNRAWPGASGWAYHRSRDSLPVQGPLGRARRRAASRRQGDSGDAAGAVARSWRSRRATSTRRAGGRRRSACRAPTARTRSCSPIRTSRRSTIRCPTTCTCRGRSGRSEAGKHVLCEKPIGLTAREARAAARGARPHRRAVAGGVHGAHASAVARVRRARRAGRIGELRSVDGRISATSTRPGEHPQLPEYGGGALMDIGCYPITCRAWMFGAEPRARGRRSIERDPRLRRRPPDVGACSTSARATRSFTCSTQLVPYQRMQSSARGPHRGRDSVQRAARPAVPDLRRRRLTLGGRGRKAIEIPTATSTRSRAICSPGPCAGVASSDPLEDSMATWR